TARQTSKARPRPNRDADHRVDIVLTDHSSHEAAATLSASGSHSSGNGHTRRAPARSTVHPGDEDADWKIPGTRPHVPWKATLRASARWMYASSTAYANGPRHAATPSTVTSITKNAVQLSRNVQRASSGWVGDVGRVRAAYVMLVANSSARSPNATTDRQGTWSPCPLGHGWHGPFGSISERAGAQLQLDRRSLGNVRSRHRVLIHDLVLASRDGRP